MILIGLMPVRNEDWCLGLSARVALKWCDRLVILNHASTDGTDAICSQLDEEYPDRIILMSERGLDWDEMAHRQAMLRRARIEAATHIAIIDADEVLTSSIIPQMRQHVESTPHGHILQLPLYNLRGGTHRYHANGIWGNRSVSVAFRDDPVLGWSGDKFHSREPGGMALRPKWPIPHSIGGVMHLWGVSECRLIEKHRAYKITEALRWPHKAQSDIDHMYSLATEGQPGHPSFGTPGTWSYADVPSEWWSGHVELLRHLDVNATPWQAEWNEAQIKKHGRDRFRGLRI